MKKACGRLCHSRPALYTLSLLAIAVLAVAANRLVERAGRATNQSYYAEEERFRHIVSQAEPQIPACRTIASSTRIALRGKALVWDLQDDSRAWAFSCLPRKLRATPSDSQMTVFLVRKSKGALIGKYNVSQMVAYDADIEVYVVYWPEGKAAGMFHFVSRPPDERTISRGPANPAGEVIGWGYDDVIVNWIKTLPRE